MMRLKKMMIIVILLCLGAERITFQKAYAVQTEIGIENDGGNSQDIEGSTAEKITESMTEQTITDIVDTGTKGFVIDNRNVYEGMTKSYSKGYIPKIEKNKAIIVLPLLVETKIKGNRIRSCVNLGEGESIPFVYKNYEKDVKKKEHTLSKKGSTAECYLVTYELELKTDRVNGSYPVVIFVAAEDAQGNALQQEFTVYVTITDGKAADDGTDGDSISKETPQFAPKVMITSYQCSKENLYSGEEFTEEIKLFNTSKTEPVKNMMVTVVPSDMIELVSPSDSVYLETLGAQQSEEISFAWKVNGAAPQGQYSIAVSMEYADSKGNTYTAQGTVKVMVEQSVKLEIDPVTFPKEIQMGETVELTVQAMNLGRGKLYNVRAVAQADGLEFAGTAFIGDIEAGTAMSGSVEARAVGRYGNSLYGATTGTVTFYYEDETGKEMQEELNFETSILSPLNQDSSQVEEEYTGQWWVIMAVIAGILLVIAVFASVRKWKEIKQDAGNP